MKIEKPVSYNLIDGLSGIFFLAWFFLPVAAGPINSSIIFRPFSLPLEYMKLVPLSVQGISLFLVYLVPLYGILKIVSLFIGNKMGSFGRPDSNFSSISRIAFTSITIAAFIIPMLKFAESALYFKSVPLISFFSFLLFICGNFAAVIFFMRILNFRDPVYREYKQFKNEQKVKQLSVKAQKSFAGLDLLFQIRAKLFFAFIGIITIILLVLSIILLRNYQTTILKAVGDAAKTQVEQASSNYRINLGDSIALFEYFNRQEEMNEKAEFSYNNLTLYTNRKNEVYVNAGNKTVPEFRAEYSTLAQGIQFPKIAAITGKEAQQYIKDYSVKKEVIIVRDQKTKAHKYISPIIITEFAEKNGTRVKHERVLGFSVMTFDNDVIMKPFFLTRNLVFFITTFFLYLSFILTYIIGNYIVNPLLFLRMNVRKISDILTTMIRGERRVSSTSLVYNDCVTSRDEIKTLSTEINDMVTVIRGIVPYISASTLKQAETGIHSSTKKELTFLFTDIRGFTTLCEGMEPDQVVDVLNRYLDLETEIILNNHGDVDKFVGDEMMAFFEGTEREVNACRAAMQIRHAMMEEKERREKEGLPIVAIGIGINTGPVVFGSVGARDRMDFTSIGDTVNLAARLEGANKAYGSKSIITETVYNRVSEYFLCRELDYIAVKGKNEPVRIYEILQEIPQTIPKLEEIKNLFEEGLHAYRLRDWEKASHAFKENIKKHNDAPSSVFLERVEHFTKNPPPEEWDGVFKMTVK